MCFKHVIQHAYSNVIKSNNEWTTIQFNIKHQYETRRFEKCLWYSSRSRWGHSRWAPRNFHKLNSSKIVWKLKFDWLYITWYCIFNTIIGIIRKPVQLSLQWYPICCDYVIMEYTVQLDMNEGQKWNLSIH